MSAISPNQRSAYDELEYSGREVTPLWSLEDLNDEKKLESWFDNAVLACEQYYRPHFQIQMDNLLLYKGIHWLSAARSNNRDFDRQSYSSSRNPRVVINHLYDLTTQWVSRLTRYKPSIAVYPARGDQKDADDAKIAKDVLDYIWYKEDIDSVTQEFARQVKIFGESYLWVLWNPQKGDVSPQWAQAQERGLRVPILDSSGSPVTNSEGQPMYMDKAIHIGDVDYVIQAPWHIFDMPTRNRKDIDWSIRWYLEDISYLKAKYPDKADKISSQIETNSIYSGYRMDERLKQQTVVYELYHRSHEFMEKGRFIKRTKGVILENSDLPYEHKKIPYVYMADIDVPDQIRGMSFYQQLFPIQHQINAVSSLIYKSLVLYAHPKITMQQNSCEIQQLLNESTIVEYSGGVPPTLLTQSPVANELFVYIDKLVSDLEKISGVFTMSRGQAPSGVRAAKALRVLEEQEDKRSFLTVTKFNNAALIENAKLTLSTAGTYYEDTDGRLARVVGQDNEYKITNFQSSNLSKDYDYRIVSTTALSQSPAARIDEITELMQMRFDPQSLLSREQTVNLLNLSAADEFKDIVTRATRCAQSENDDFLAKREVTDPAPYEDLITHWKIHLQAVQSREYKELVEPDVKAKLERHIQITEYFMHEKAYGITDSQGLPIRAGNPMFMQRLQIECPDFPTFLNVSIPPMQLMQSMGAPAPIGGGGMTAPNSQQTEPTS